MPRPLARTSVGQQPREDVLGAAQVLGHLARGGDRVVAARERRHESPMLGVGDGSTSGGWAISAIRPDIAPWVSVIAVTSRGLRVASARPTWKRTSAWR